jgi:hypothetical protein
MSKKRQNIVFTELYHMCLGGVRLGLWRRTGFFGGLDKLFSEMTFSLFYTVRALFLLFLGPTVDLTYIYLALLETNFSNLIC